MSILDWFKEIPLSAVLKERLVDVERKLIACRNRVTALEAKISVLNTKGSTLENENIDLRTENVNFKDQVAHFEVENDCLKVKLHQSEKQRGALDKQIMKIQSDTSSGYFCDHCGSPKLKRIGNRPDRKFGRLGIKQAVFSCSCL